MAEETQMPQEKKEVIITGLKIPFWDLVWFMVKFAFASIPALFIIYFIIGLFSALIGIFVGGFAGHPQM
ncbi:hypothetical protein [Nitratiruptor sp. YY09-18]|uniref:hypothetical protein n=1 Tax=Nitratiruptor sp. YY09-18 TaxID=2724901 RepID=UPI0019150FFF|nr:hypothetical protein [Nitratiruptor sp. YY09-18]BCD68850.1 hypothetical protein NitYY0918_C1769 [Nitratiruptor sp. YY09-18]